MVAFSISSPLNQPQGRMFLHYESDTSCVHFQMEYRKNIEMECLLTLPFLECWDNCNSLALVIPCACSLCTRGLLDSIFPVWCYTNRLGVLIYLSIRVFFNISSFQVWILSNISFLIVGNKRWTFFNILKFNIPGKS